MAEFDESKVINALHTEKAKVGKKYWYTDNLKLLKKYVEENDSERIGELNSIEEGENFCRFRIDKKCSWELLYPYEEPPKKRMTYRQLAEWLAKGNGQYTTGGTIYHDLGYNNCDNADGNTLKECYKIRTWDSEKWIEPTVDIYERDCKKE